MHFLFIITLYLELSLDGLRHFPLICATQHGELSSYAQLVDVLDVSESVVICSNEILRGLTDFMFDDASGCGLRHDALHVRVSISVMMVNGVLLLICFLYDYFSGNVRL